MPNVWVQRWTDLKFSASDRSNYEDDNNYGFYHDRRNVFRLASSQYGLKTVSESQGFGGYDVAALWTHLREEVGHEAFDTAYFNTLWEQGVEEFVEAVELQDHFHDFALKLHNTGEDSDRFQPVEGDWSLESDGGPSGGVPEFPHPNPDGNEGHRYQLPVSGELSDASIRHNANLGTVSVKMYRFERSGEAMAQFILPSSDLSEAEQADVKATLVLTPASPDPATGVLECRDGCAGQQRRLALPFDEPVMVCFDASTPTCEGLSSGDLYGEIETIDVILSNSSWDEGRDVHVFFDVPAAFVADELVMVDPEFALPESPVGFRIGEPLSLKLYRGEGEQAFVFDFEAEHAWFDFSDDFYARLIPQEDGDAVHQDHIANYFRYGAGFRGHSRLEAEIREPMEYLEDADPPYTRYPLTIRLVRDKTGGFYDTHHSFRVDPSRVDPLPGFGPALQSFAITAAHQQYGEGSLPWRIQHAVYQLFYLGVDPSSHEGEIELLVYDDGRVEFELSSGYRVTYDPQ